MLNTKIIRFFFLSSLIICGNATPLNAQEKATFGVKMGDPISNYQVIKEIKPYLYRIKNVPSLQEEFPLYFIRHHESTGVCLVSGSGWPIETDSSGTQLKAEFDVMYQKISERFGNGKLSFYVTNGNTNLWKKHFMSKLQRQEAVLAGRWSYRNGSKMVGQVLEVLLFASGLGYGKGQINIQLKFNNYNECLKAQRIDMELKKSGHVN
jgi:hypothetical protein